MKKITELTHDLLLETNGSIAIDFTCGNGFDTYFLANNYQQVYAFDIQKIAIDTAKNKCSEFNNISFILDSHANVNKYVDNFDAGIFNCGYLPHGDTSITTTSSSVIDALNNCLPNLNSKGRIIIVLYPGFEQGAKEAIEIEQYVNNLSSKTYDVFKIQITNRNHVPYIIGIDKH